MSVPLRDVSLADKYTKTEGRILINGVQALARLPMVQQAIDHRAGLNTSGFISGYRGSPLGGLDSILNTLKQQLVERNIIFQPGINEELAATSVLGSQQLISVPDPTVDGVFAIWYGKGPGVDRAGDALKHGNYAGVNPNGGVLVVYGDDHPGKSSTVAHQSEQALAANLIPSLYPASVAEFLGYGLLGWALSRYSGLWVGFKCVNETVEQTATIDIDLDSQQIVIPEPTALPEQGIHYRGGPFNPQADEEIVVDYRLPLVHQFVRANGIDRLTLGGAHRRLGIVTAGKSWLDVMQALQLLGIDEQRAEELGISVYKVGCIWPLEPMGIREFAAGQQELLVVEEKKAFLEEQTATILYNVPQRPRLVGKSDDTGAKLLSSTIQLEPIEIAQVITRRLRVLGVESDDLQSRVAALMTHCKSAGTSTAQRMPFFCSGCPHNTSTKVPEDSYMMAGIGCHGMVSYIRPNTLLPTQMGGEGTNWIGLSHFTKTPHIFQNLGDGTYYHSGLLAIRASVAAATNITYKILYNDAVAMTGGQPHDGPLSVAKITHQVLHEGVKRCVLLSDQPEKYGSGSGLHSNVDVFHRDELDYVQRELRDAVGCTVLIFEQTCAVEKRRRRKKGEFPNPARRMFINDAVCEGCGDCSTQSNCVSLLPLETALGRKRQIDQSSCNKDYSCVKGFCPSFVTVYDGEPKKPVSVGLDEALFAGLPAPNRIQSSENTYGVMIAGIGGTGVITVSALLGMAAHLENRACSIFDMTGLSQKNGAVYSHLKIADDSTQISAQRLGAGDADLILGFDMIAALGDQSFQTINDQSGHFIGNSRVAPTALFQFDPDARIDESLLNSKVVDRIGETRTHLLDATGLAMALCGDTIGANLFVVGFAAQKGLLPVGIEAIERAVELNGVAIAFNLKALRLGRLFAHDPGKVLEMTGDHSTMLESKLPKTLDEVVNHRVALLSAYQDATYAQRYRILVEQVARVERERTPAKNGLALAVANYYAKLLAYKDEYEVARLYSEPVFLEKLRDQFEGGFKLAFNLAPPLLSKRDLVTGHLKKREFGPWILPAFRLLARLRFLRGTAFDIFGMTAERREERQLIRDYEKLVGEVLDHLNEDNHAFAVQLAELPETIRGFGHVKERHVTETRERWNILLEAFHQADQLQVVEVEQCLS